MLAEHGDKAGPEVRSAIETALEDLKGVLDSGDSDAIAAKSEALKEAAMKLGEAMYKAQGEAGGGEAGGEQPQDDGVVDAEFEEVDGDDKKSA
jgi:molecular chaperone DnaK